MIAVRLFGYRLSLDRQLASALSIMLCALPGLALYYINTAISRGMKVMRHDIFSRGITQSTVTSVAFLLALAVGLQTFAPAFAAVAGTAASGIVALALAWSLFRTGPKRSPGFSYRGEAVRLLSYAANISAYDVLNALIVRMDVIMLACFIGRAPGVTLPARALLHNAPPVSRSMTSRHRPSRATKAYRGTTWGWSSDANRRASAMKRLRIIVPVVLLLIAGFLYGSFGVIRQALLVMMNVPFAVVGGIAALWLRGLHLNLSAAVGFIALFGVTVQNCVIMVSNLNRWVFKGVPLQEAIVHGASERLRPGLMTATVATKSCALRSRSMSLPPGSRAAANSSVLDRSPSQSAAWLSSSR